MFSGSIVALVTPFNEMGQVDFMALEHLIRWHIEQGTDGLVLCGSTGEGSQLSKNEKSAIFHLATEISGGTIAIIAATGSNQTAESVELTAEAKKCGVDGCIAIVPYYCLPTEEGCFSHFSEIAKVDLPMILYHHPGRTGIKLSARGIARICELPQVVAVKEVSGDFNLALEILSLTQTPLLSGDDTLSLPQFSIGFSGSISIVENVVPMRWKAYVTTALMGDFPKARELFLELYPLCKSLVLETNPQCVKYAVSQLGKCLPKMRLPLLEPAIPNQEKIKEQLIAITTQHLSAEF